jgi:phosphatidylserine/phosphatidylglycerophosphate/cardiolipin synthase-like enzyme
MSTNRRRPRKKEQSTEAEEYQTPQDRQTQLVQLLLFGGLALVGIAVVAIVLLLFVGQPQANEQAAAPTATQDPREEVGGNSLTPVVESSVIEGALGSGGRYRGDWYELYFNAPVYPDNKANHKGGLDQVLVNFMNSAERTLDVAVYDFDLQNVADAMARAAARGVKVRMVTDTDTINNKNEDIQKAIARVKQAKITIIEDNDPDIMHHKFTVVDNKAVSTGSMNYTDGDTYRLNNNMIIIRNELVAQNFTFEFEKMYVNKKFGTDKAKSIPPYQILLMGSTRVETYFAPEDGVAKRIVDRINTAKTSLNFMAFSFTQNDMGNAILARAKAGVKVSGVFETTGSNTQFSEYKTFSQEGLEVYTDGNPYVMHHKVIIIDDRITIFGSFNFSENADKRNDENLLIVEDPAIARAFKTEYERVLAVAKAKKR